MIFTLTELKQQDIPESKLTRSPGPGLAQKGIETSTFHC